MKGARFWEWPHSRFAKKATESIGPCCRTSSRAEFGTEYIHSSVRSARAALLCALTAYILSSAFISNSLIVMPSYG